MLCFVSLARIDEDRSRRRRRTVGTRFGRARALLLGVLLPALLMVLAAPPVLAQVNNWGGDVLVSDSSISVAPGESVTYSVRLNRKPTETDGTTLHNETVEWFVMVHINGVRYQDGEYKDLTLIPSFYRSFTGKHVPNHPNDDGNWMSGRASGYIEPAMTIGRDEEKRQANAPHW